MRSPWKPDGWTPKMPFGALAGTAEPTEPTPTTTAQKPPAEESDSNPVSGIATAGSALADRLPGTNRLVGFVTGKKENIPKAQKLYQKADALFRKAENSPKDQRVKMFSQAAKYFDSAGKAAVGSALHQDALFMQGESLFFANELTDARDTFELLQKDFPRNRHSDRVAARLFSISKYWIDTTKAGADSWYSVNLFDETRPMLDSAGHAIKVLDQIRYDDPTGKLADDATMAAAAEHIRNREFEQADEFLTDLRETFTDSDHMFLAHMLGIRCKLEIYAGPQYSERVLDEADKLVKQTKRRFPDRLTEEKYAEMIARAAAEISYHKAEKLAFRAKYRERQGENKAAAEMYRKILRDHSDTPQAEQAREVLAVIEKLPAKPSRPLAALSKVFPDSKATTPLSIITGPSGDAPQAPQSTGKTKLR